MRVICLPEATWLPQSGAVSFWMPRLASLGAGFWFLTLITVPAGVFTARGILRPDAPVPDDDPVAVASFYRTVVGFAFVLALSWSYSSPGDTVDESLGSFNITVIV